MKLLAVFSSLAAVALAAHFSVPVSNDVGLVYTNILCGDYPCGITNLSGQKSYMAFSGNRDIRRILMSFSVPDDVDEESITSCKLRMPQPITSDNASKSSYVLAVYPVTEEYDAKTVTPITAPPIGDIIGSTKATDDVAPLEIDVTDACKNLINGNVQLLISASGGPVNFSSSWGGDAAELVIATE
ncbi:hypothetical protein GGF46_002027 [Coemansia sp. RSA 552]|nr:hypothetical protein GGF46_002027 [Coemansia sp. RSA 552]